MKYQSWYGYKVSAISLIGVIIFLLGTIFQYNINRNNVRAEIVITNDIMLKWQIMPLNLTCLLVYVLSTYLITLISYCRLSSTCAVYVLLWFLIARLGLETRLNVGFLPCRQLSSQGCVSVVSRLCKSEQPALYTWACMSTVSPNQHSNKH